MKLLAEGKSWACFFILPVFPCCVSLSKIHPAVYATPYIYSCRNDVATTLALPTLYSQTKEKSSSCEAQKMARLFPLNPQKNYDTM